MDNERRRGIGAMMIAIGAIGVLLWLAVARLSAETAFGRSGLFVGSLMLVTIAIGAYLLRRRPR